MWRRLLAWLRGEPPDPLHLDPDALDISRRQRRVAQRLAKATGRTPEELLDYRSADRILSERR